MVTVQSHTGRSIISKHIPALDGLRGVAVLIVFSYHYGGGTHSTHRALQLIGQVNKGGWTGVVLFFTLSGFLITGILWDSLQAPSGLTKFLVRRALRIFPLYYLALFSSLVAAFCWHVQNSVVQKLWVPFFYLQDVPSLAHVPDNLLSPLPVFHLWSVAVEVHIYLAWCFLFLCFAREMKTMQQAFVAIYIVSASFRAFVWLTMKEAATYEHALLTHIGSFAAGGWLALAYRRNGWLTVVRRARPTALAGALGFFAAGVTSHRFDMAGRQMMTLGLFFISIFFTSLIALSLEPGFLSRLFTMFVFRWLGELSYGIYVFHMLLLNVFRDLAERLSGQQQGTRFVSYQFMIAALMSSGLSFLSYNLLEKKVLYLKRSF